MEFKQELVRIILGIGNPVPIYKNTYHNAGIMFVAHLINQTVDKPCPRESPKFTLLHGEGLYVARSKTYMNESGEAACQLLRCCGWRPCQLLVVHDDSDLKLGQFRFHFGRGDAGHHGIISVVKALGTPDFWRLRLGVRAERFKQKPAEDFILRRMPVFDSNLLNSVFNDIIRKNFRLVFSDPH